MDGAQLPDGTVTFLFTDIEGSTRLIEVLGEDGYVEALREHRRLLRAAFATHGGVEVDTQGDAFLYAFADPPEAVAAAAEGQEALESGRVRVRMGLHTGPVRRTGEGYAGRELHRAARIAASGHGGQVVVSATTRALVAGDLTELGEHRLKDFDEPVALFQLGRQRFPPLKTISNTNLPRPASSFVGRQRERDELVAMLSDGTRLVTLSGPGGSGKTRLAVESATELVGEFKAGVFWVGLSALRDPALVTGAIAQALGAKNGLAEHVADRELLLVLDNFEQVVDAAPGLGQLLESCPNLKVLVTSRERLRIRGEVEYPVPPLAEPEAVELFCIRSRLEADKTIAELCRRLDELPLALELAAARTSVLSPAEILERLTHRLDLLRGGRDSDPRQQTLRSTIEWSHDLLDEDEQRLFADLAVFRGGCTLEAAEQVADAKLDALQSLVDKSLVRHSADRFWMLETIREFALERLEGRPEACQILERHARWYLNLAKSAQGELRGAAGGKWLGRLDADLENLRRALGWARDHDERLEVELAGATWYFLFVRARLSEALNYLAHALETARSASLDQGELLYGAGSVAFSMGDYAAAQQWYGQLLDLGRARGEVQLIARSLATLADVALQAGEPERSQALCLDAVDAAGECGDKLTLMIAAHALAEIALARGETETARTHYQRELELARELPNPRSEAGALSCLSHVALLEGATDDAQRDLTTALRLISALGERANGIECLLGLSEVATQRSEMTRAARLLAAVDALREESGFSLDAGGQRQRERIVAALRDYGALAALAEEHALTFGEAVAYALERQP
jgi:predicted ATPase